jgi:predicted metal-dependent hydrolase
MIEALKPWQGKVPEPLATDVAAFIVQEAAHTREHGAMNRALIASGYDMVPLERAIKGFVRTFANAGDITKLGATMCIEHLTAIVAAELLHRPHHLQGSDPEMQKLWFWHGIEEIEHKAVAFDTWMYATRHWSPMRRWMVRSSLMAAVSISFFINRTRGQVELMRQDGIGWKKALPMLMRQGFAKGGIGRAVLKPWFHFLKPGFHPWQIDDHHLVAKGEAMLAALQIVTEGQPVLSPEKPAIVATAA